MSTQTNLTGSDQQARTENGRSAATRDGATSRSSVLRDPETWRGWIGFAALLLFVIGSLDFLQGLIAIVRDHYYALDSSQVIVVDLRTWGWVTLCWGSIVALAGFGLLWRSEIARWVAIIVSAVGVVLELGFAGSTHFTLWALAVVSFNVVVLYALVVHWDEVPELPAR